FSTSVIFHVVVLTFLLALPMIFTEGLAERFNYVPLAVLPDRQILEPYWLDQPPSKPTPRATEKILPSPSKLVQPVTEPPLVVAKQPEPAKIEVSVPNVNTIPDSLNLANKTS